jgi:CRP-like cAMP-binding protein
VVTLHGGDCFGEQAAISEDHRRNATVKVCEPTELLAITRSGFISAMAELESVKQESIIFQPMLTLQQTQASFTDNRAGSKVKLLDQLTQRFPVFSEMDEGTRTDLLNAMDYHSFDSETAIYHAGDNPDNMYVLLDGRVKMTMQAKHLNRAVSREHEEEGSQRNHHKADKNDSSKSHVAMSWIVAEGQCLGEAELLTKASHRFTNARTMTKVQAISLSKVRYAQLWPFAPKKQAVNHHIHCSSGGSNRRRKFTPSNQEGGGGTGSAGGGSIGSVGSISKVDNVDVLRDEDAAMHGWVGADPNSREAILRWLVNNKGRLGLFATASSRDLYLMSLLMRTTNLPSKSTVGEEGTPVKRLHIVRSGGVKIVATMAEVDGGADASASATKGSDRGTPRGSVKGGANKGSAKQRKNSTDAQGSSEPQQNQVLFSRGKIRDQKEQLEHEGQAARRKKRQIQRHRIDVSVLTAGQTFGEEVATSRIWQETVVTTEGSILWMLPIADLEVHLPHLTPMVAQTARLKMSWRKTKINNAQAGWKAYNSAATARNDIPLGTSSRTAVEGVSELEQGTQIRTAVQKAQAPPPCRLPQSPAGWPAPSPSPRKRQQIHSKYNTSAGSNAPWTPETRSSESFGANRTKHLSTPEAGRANASNTGAPTTPQDQATLSSPAGAFSAPPAQADQSRHFKERLKRGGTAGVLSAAPRSAPHADTVEAQALRERGDWLGSSSFTPPSAFTPVPSSPCSAGGATAPMPANNFGGIVMAKGRRGVSRPLEPDEYEREYQQMRAQQQQGSKEQQGSRQQGTSSVRSTSSKFSRSSSFRSSPAPPVRTRVPVPTSPMVRSRAPADPGAHQFLRMTNPGKASTRGGVDKNRSSSLSASLRSKKRWQRQQQLLSDRPVGGLPSSTPLASRRNEGVGFLGNALNRGAGVRPVNL